ncbi:putative dihydrofolate reductase-like [Capsicum annuum]|nr:putative dihydrofolate reductase-like [Capsicum annuum]
MPFFLSIVVVVSCSCWFIYALLGIDQFIGTAIGVDLGLVVVQLILYFIYHDKKSLNKIAFAAGESIQMEKYHSNNVKSYNDEKQSNFHEDNQHSNQSELVAVSNLTKKMIKASQSKSK